MIGVILQPTYLPWLGYFEMISAADIFVVYDHVQFVKKTFQNRNRIKGPNGDIVLIVPTKKSPRNTSLSKTLLADGYEKTLHRHWVSISHFYKKAKYFNDYSPEIESMYLSKYSSLTDLTISFIRFFCNHLGITTLIEQSSNFVLDRSLSSSSERVVDLCVKANISTLYDAIGAQKIINTSFFKTLNIEVLFQNYVHPQYHQNFGDFSPYMSIIDLLLNEGPNSLEIIKSGRRDPVSSCS